MTATRHSDRLQYGPLLPYGDQRAGGVPNQLLFRELNEQLLARRASAGGKVDVVCECEHRGCSERISIALDRYEAIRRFPTRFVVAPGHWAGGDERVVEERDGFSVVEKTGPSARIAIRLDPRSRTPGVRPAA